MLNVAKNNNIYIGMDDNQLGSEIDRVLRSVSSRSNLLIKITLLTKVDSGVKRVCSILRLPQMCYNLLSVNILNQKINARSISVLV